MQKKILLVTNGCEDSWATVQYAVWIAVLLKLPITLLGVVEKDNEEHPVEVIFSRAVTLFREKGVVYDLQLVDGETEDVLAGMSWSDETYLFVGPLGRSQFRHWLVGRSFRKIMEDVSSPIFYIRSARLALKKVLVCFSGFGYAEKVEELGITIGKMAGAELAFLHVVPPVESDHLPGNVADDAKLMNEHSTRILQEAQAHAKDSGVKSQVIVRHGHVINQILEELESGKYDLICMGSSFSYQDSLRNLYTPNVTAEIAEAIDAPILTARCCRDQVRGLA